VEVSDPEVSESAAPVPVPKRKRVTRDEAKRPFNETELRLVLEYSRKMVWNRRVDAFDGGGNYAPGFETFPDPRFVGDTSEALLATAIHVCYLARLTPAHVSVGSAGHATVDWLRPKTTQHVFTPIPDDMVDWLRGYLSLPKPRTEPAYLKMFGRLGSKIEVAEGLRVHINPLRFRHTGIVLLKHRFNLTDQETATMAGTTVQTVQRYATEDATRVLERVFAQGYDTLVR
jgi:hypothetical protein